MMKMFIEFDENRIIQDGKYDLDKIYASLAKAFAKRNMTKDTDNWYTNGDFTTCGSLILVLSQKDWFMNYVKEWLWYDSDDGSTEDLKAHYCKETVSV